MPKLTPEYVASLKALEEELGAERNDGLDDGIYRGRFENSGSAGENPPSLRVGIRVVDGPSERRYQSSFINYWPRRGDSESDNDFNTRTRKTRGMFTRTVGELIPTSLVNEIPDSLFAALTLLKSAGSDHEDVASAFDEIGDALEESEFYFMVSHTPDKDRAGNTIKSYLKIAYLDPEDERAVSETSLEGITV
jgi:hypothetical protein